MDSTHLFLIDVAYVADLPIIEAHLAEHRAYLARGYKEGFLLASGPKTPRTGGMIIGRFVSKNEAQAFANNDPFALKGVANHTIVEFDPVLYAKDIAKFLTK
ncbi:YciI family protein [Helicobacter sp.]|uniref:YciI family protein n=1 Tax=Helicobacter sp. TaxID=218 RepID=UPI0025C21F97|nr:YciI family protein [Helicobacter sp.]MBR2495007.1 GTP cyclohydrolase [Helicobacter sp.]